MQPFMYIALFYDYARCHSCIFHVLLADSSAAFPAWILNVAVHMSRWAGCAESRHLHLLFVWGENPTEVIYLFIIGGVAFQTRRRREGNRSSLSTVICFMGYAERDFILMMWVLFCVCVSWTAEWSLCSPLLEDGTPSLPVIVLTLLKVTAHVFPHQSILFSYIVNRQLNISATMKCPIFITLHCDCTEIKFVAGYLIITHGVHKLLWRSHSCSFGLFQQILVSFSTWKIAFNGNVVVLLL